jgi:glycosyltransferase involved in cell wall biosynthesis
MITIALTYRNKDLRIVKNCLDSLAEQSYKNFKVILVDYGSDESFANPLIELVNQFHFIELISCPVQGQLWNKSRAINIALRQTATAYFLVGDIDMLFRRDFMEEINQFKSLEEIVYFQVGFLSQKESEKQLTFHNYVINHFSTKEATGITLYPTDLLKSINGYDEFYHGWGAEDSDVHVRVRNAGHEVRFYDKIVLLLHQWHPKSYRSKESGNPFHSNLERINHSYLELTDISRRIKVNLNLEWGKTPLQSDYRKLLNRPDYTIEIQSIDVKVMALLAQLKNFETELVYVSIKEVSLQAKMKQGIKKSLGKKSHVFWSVEAINNRLLEEIIVSYRNLPYSYSFNRQNGEIQLLIQF